MCVTLGAVCPKGPAHHSLAHIEATHWQPDRDILPGVFWLDGSKMATNVAVSVPPATTRRVQRSRFFFGAALILLLTVFVGFAPTLFLRAFFDVPPIPMYLYFHGAMVSGWFIWLATQTWLISAGRTSTHRRIGWIGAAFGVLVVVAALTATIGLIPHLYRDGIELDQPLPFAAIALNGSPFATWLEFTSWVVWTNVVNILTFAACVMAAILLRRHIEAHKRLMLVASISIIGPPLARISRWPILGGREDARILFGALVIFILGVAVFDLVRKKRLHPATAIAGVLSVVSTLAGSIFASGELAQSLVRALR